MRPPPPPIHTPRRQERVGIGGGAVAAWEKWACVLFSFSLVVVSVSGCEARSLQNTSETGTFPPAGLRRGGSCLKNGPPGDGRGGGWVPRPTAHALLSTILDSGACWKARGGGCRRGYQRTRNEGDEKREVGRWSSKKGEKKFLGQLGSALQPGAVRQQPRGWASLPGALRRVGGHLLPPLPSQLSPQADSFSGGFQGIQDWIEDALEQGATMIMPQRNPHSSWE